MLVIFWGGGEGEYPYDIVFYLYIETCFFLLPFLKGCHAAWTVHIFKPPPLITTFSPHQPYEDARFPAAPSEGFFERLKKSVIAIVS